MTEQLDDTQKSEFVIARILERLMKRGLQRGILQFNDLDLEDNFLPFFTTCVNWLIGEGIIRVSTAQEFSEGEGAYVNAVLTAHGYSLLGQPVLMGEERQKLGEAVKKVSSERVSYARFGDFLGGVLGGLAKSLGS